VLHRLFRLLRVMSSDHRSSPFLLPGVISESLFSRSSFFDRAELYCNPETAEKIKEEFCYVCPDIVKEFTRFDKKEPESFQKYFIEQHPGGRKVTVDVGYERFLAPEILFNPGIYSSDFLTPLPTVVDTVIQSSPIDVRRGLYKVPKSIPMLGPGLMNFT